MKLNLVVLCEPEDNFAFAQNDLTLHTDMVRSRSDEHFRNAGAARGP